MTTTETVARIVARQSGHRAERWAAWAQEFRWSDELEPMRRARTLTLRHPLIDRIGFSINARAIEEFPVGFDILQDAHSDMANRAFDLLEGRFLEALVTAYHSEENATRWAVTEAHRRQGIYGYAPPGAPDYTGSFTVDLAFDPFVRPVNPRPDWRRLATACEAIQLVTAHAQPSPYLERQAAVIALADVATFGLVFAELGRLGTVARSWVMEMG